jgi:hypothetical protein
LEVRVARPVPPSATVNGVQLVVVTPPLAVEHTGVPAVVEIVAALASPESVPTIAFEDVIVVAVAAIGT